jgi:RNA polymerase-binding protein DksA
MNLETQTHLKALRDALEYRRRELQGEVQGAEQARREQRIGGEVTDLKDDAQRLASSAVDDAEQRRDHEELEQIERALQRLDAGTYGDCLQCGEPIALQRLRAMPAAERCAACQAVRERARHIV